MVALISNTPLRIDIFVRFLIYYVGQDGRPFSDVSTDSSPFTHVKDLTSVLLQSLGVSIPITYSGTGEMTTGWVDRHNDLLNVS